MVSGNLIVIITSVHYMLMRLMPADKESQYKNTATREQMLESKHLGLVSLYVAKTKTCIF